MREEWQRELKFGVNVNTMKKRNKLLTESIAGPLWQKRPMDFRDMPR